MKKLFLLLVLFIVIIILDIYFEVNCPKTSFVEIKSSKIPSGKKIKILQITDYHNSRLGSYVLKFLKELSPDLIFITGDLIDRRTNDYTNVYNLSEEIVKINPNVYFVTGNHEWARKNVAEFLSGLTKRGIKVLRNSNTNITISGVRINICGVDDYYTKHSNINRAFYEIDKDMLTILLSHSPDIVIKEKNIPADIILSGHTHGGQIRLPLIGAVIAPGQGLFPKYSKGIYEIGKTTLYIDSGLGISEIPVRFLNRSQASLITIY